MSYTVFAEHNNQNEIETVDPDGMQSQNQCYIDTIDPYNMESQNQRYVEMQSSTDVSVVAPSQTNNVPSSCTSRTYPCTVTPDFLTMRKLYI